jgi:hypothetical protein
LCVAPTTGFTRTCSLSVSDRLKKNQWLVTHTFDTVAGRSHLA